MALNPEELEAARARVLEITTRLSKVATELDEIKDLVAHSLEDRERLGDDNAE